MFWQRVSFGLLSSLFTSLRTRNLESEFSYSWLRSRRHPIWGVAIGLLLCWLIGVPGSWGHQSTNLSVLPAETLSVPVQSLDGEWQFLPDSAATTTLLPASELPDFDWSPGQAIAVPANWYTEGYDISGVAWYRTTFSVDESLPERLTLIFQGVDYAADVWLNGQYLGFHEGYFQPFDFPVSEVIQRDEENELVVRVNSPLESAPQDWSLYKRLIKGVLSHHDARPGGAWSDRGQEKNTGGIWAPVMLRGSQTLAIQQVQVTPDMTRYPRSAIAHVQVNVATDPERAVTTLVKAQLLPVNFDAPEGEVFGLTQTLAPGEDQLTLDIPQPNPHLWWTWDHGQPNLYELRVQIWAGDRLLDADATRFGFRTIERDPNQHWFKLNGRRLFLKGTNYIPDQWLSQLTRDRLQQDIQLMQGAHINAVRVHAHVTAPDFYDLADEAGVLVWQDFPLQWGYEDTPTFANEAIRQGRSMIAQLYNHPSIFVWSLHNEPPWNAFWMADQYESYDSDHNRGLNQVLYQALSPEDPTRYLHPASILAEHPWWGWYSNTYEKYAEPTDHPLITEFGAQALPDIPALERIFAPEYLWPQTEADWAEWQYRNFQPRETFELAQIDQGSTLEEFVHNTQTYQARLHQYAAEAYRRQRYQPVSAIFQFMFCEPWPSISWGMVDYWRTPKAGYAGLQTAYQPILPSIETPAFPQPVGTAIPIRLWAINDTWQPLHNATLIYTIHEGDRLIRETTLAFNVSADALKRLDQIEFMPDHPGEYQLTAVIQDENQTVLGENHYILSMLPT